MTQGGRPGRPPAYAIKADIADAAAELFAFVACKTMYGGKLIAAGDTLFVFAGDRGLIAEAIVTSAQSLDRTPGLARQTPRVSIAASRVRTIAGKLGRAELARFKDWDDGRPETELNFKFYRQATNKIVSLSPNAAAFLSRQ